VATGVALLYAAGCGAQQPDTAAASTEAASPPELAAQPEPVLVPEENPELLSEWNQLEIDSGVLTVADGVVPYDLNSALFSDYSLKLRTVSVPEGTPAEYEPDDVFSFPVGTVITKTFYYPVVDEVEAAEPARARVAKRLAPSEPLGTIDLAAVQLIETRVLVHRSDGWDALPYLWNEDQNEATLERVGDLIPLTLVDEAGSEQDFPYVVPNVNQCANCHAVNHTAGVIVPIGPKARHLNRDVDYGNGPIEQLEHWEQLGLLTDGSVPPGAPRAAVWDDLAAPLDGRARAYLDINCAHCHNEVGPADTSGLFLEAATDTGPRLGICKSPIAAGTGTGGRAVGIHPGQPESSIFVYRLETTDPGAMMPELGRALTHFEGVELITDWIRDLEGSC
jgi:uncharacterized repeat protein (TIGR03806 family)